MGLPERFKDARKRAQLSQDDLSRASGLVRSIISTVERGRHVPTIATVEKIAAGLGVSPAWLAFGHEAYWQFRQKQPKPAIPFDDPEPKPGHSPYVGAGTGCGERVRQGREQLGLALRPLADAAQVSYQTVALVESGATVPRVDTIEAIAVALDVPPGWLAYGEPPPEC